MRQFVHIAAFWIVVVIAARLAVCFPRSLLARVLHFELGPARIRGEREADFRLRRARNSANWFAQAALLYLMGWALLRQNAALADSLYFLVMWRVIVPMIGASALAMSSYELARFALLRCRDRSHTAASADEAQT